MKNRFKPNDTVMYGGHGACTLTEITEKNFGGETKDYYVLSPVFSGSSIFYVPLDSEILTAKIHLLNSADDILELISSCRSTEWVLEDRARQNGLKAMLDGGGTKNFIEAYKMLLEKQAEYKAENKKMRAADERIMKDIERLLFEEFSFSFKITREDIAPFILGELQPIKK